MEENGFSWQAKGATLGIFRPMKSINAMPTDDKYKTLIPQMVDLSFLETTFKTFLCENMFQSMISIDDHDSLFVYYMKINIINNLILLDVNDKNGISKIISNTNITYSFYPFYEKYVEKEQIKIKKYKMELEILARIGEMVDSIDVDTPTLIKLFSELISNILFKKKNMVNTSEILTLFSNVKQQILNDEKMNILYDSFFENKIHTNINKQGITTKNNIYYNSPVFYTENQKNKIANFKIENFKNNLPNIMQNSISCLHPITTMATNNTKIHAKELFRYIKHYKQIVKIFDIDTKDSLYKMIFNDFLKIKSENNKVTTVIKNIEKEVIMNTPWFDVGKQISKGVYFMHSKKAPIQRNKAISSSKEELVNAISMKTPKVRGDIIIKKYLTKFDLSSLFSDEPEKLLEMSDEGLKEFILGLYISSNKTVEE